MFNNHIYHPYNSQLTVICQGWPAGLWLSGSLQWAMGSTIPLVDDGRQSAAIRRPLFLRTHQSTEYKPPTMHRSSVSTIAVSPRIPTLTGASSQKDRAIVVFGWRVGRCMYSPFFFNANSLLTLYVICPNRLLNEWAWPHVHPLFGAILQSAVCWITTVAWYSYASERSPYASGRKTIKSVQWWVNCRSRSAYVPVATVTPTPSSTATFVSSLIASPLDGLLGEWVWCPWKLHFLF